MPKIFLIIPMILFFSFIIIGTISCKFLERSEKKMEIIGVEIRMGDKVRILDKFYKGTVGIVLDYELWQTTGLLGYNLGTWKKYIVKINENTPHEQIIKVNENELERIF